MRFVKQVLKDVREKMEQNIKKENEINGASIQT